jgi:hypothetical protein
MRAGFLRSCLGPMALMLMLAGCGKESSASGLDSSKRLNDLTDEEKGQFCDWAVSKLGGYGVTCSSSWGFMSYPDRDTCVRDGSSPSNTPKCEATVGQAEACVNSVPRCASFQDLKASSVCSVMTVC